MKAQQLAGAVNGVCSPTWSMKAVPGISLLAVLQGISS